MSCDVLGGRATLTFLYFRSTIVYNSYHLATSPVAFPLCGKLKNVALQVLEASKWTFVKRTEQAVGTTQNLSKQQNPVDHPMMESYLHGLERSLVLLSHLPQPGSLLYPPTFFRIDPCMNPVKAMTQNLSQRLAKIELGNFLHFRIPSNQLFRVNLNHSVAFPPSGRDNAGAVRHSSNNLSESPRRNVYPCMNAEPPSRFPAPYTDILIPCAIKHGAASGEMQMQMETHCQIWFPFKACFLSPI
ncbi:hypothetical protein BDP27DRAFT_1419067 [Rhodocollybia butyracea]|uniref:Uncharacterized protein n=1 Tax=Rhodocollybia butyracea TaxID=206335 RepID=A0A9P5PYD1_9AGAR|nr:hypothetical protein BDP27DRAFT_1419067 [Rhodocollybia butyracea]